MMCRRPFRDGSAEYPCGQCMPCRVNRRRLWTGRLLLEAQLHDDTCFLTLTYSPEHLPPDGSVHVRHYQLFLKRLRKLIFPRKVRYCFVGEYGDLSERPHYHAILFGVSKLDQDVLAKAWPFGYIYVGELTKASCAYTVSYVVKAMTRGSDPRLKGRNPEFARFSLKPGLGAGAAEVFGEALTSDTGSRSVAESGDVPGSFRSDGSRYPLGRYIRSKIREASGFAEPGMPKETARQKSIQRYEEIMSKGGPEQRDLVRKQHEKNVTARHKLYHSRKLKKGL